jgi:hypothetical protein
MKLVCELCIPFQWCPLQSIQIKKSAVPLHCTDCSGAFVASLIFFEIGLNVEPQLTFGTTRLKILAYFAVI